MNPGVVKVIFGLTSGPKKDSTHRENPLCVVQHPLGNGEAVVVPKRTARLMAALTATIIYPSLQQAGAQPQGDIASLTSNTNKALGFVRSLHLDAQHNRFIVGEDPLGPLRSNPGQDPTILRNQISLNRSVAGLQPTLLAPGFVPQDRILNGVPISRHEIVALQTKSGALCSGTLIDETHVLTAYHCTCDSDGPATESVWFMVKNPLDGANTAISAMA
jgi:hypothetical protein